MKQQQFETLHEAEWSFLESEFEAEDTQLDEQFPLRYRKLCHQLSLAKHRRYSPYLINRLNRLVLEAHHRFYQGGGRYQAQWIRFLVWDFPRVLRANAKFIYCSLALFLVPGLVMGIGCYLNAELIYSIMGPQEVYGFEYMYDPDSEIVGRGEERKSDSDLQMFGFYIKNNIGIGFQTFAGGIFLGLGSIFFLVYNGLAIGAAAGHITQLGYIETFYPFVVGHGSFELTAIVFAGAAGLKIGHAIIAPGNYNRINALRLAAQEAIQIMFGTGLMLLIAAFIEAFWSSSSTIPIAVKYGVGAGLWLFVMAYCLFAGRNFGSR